MFLNSIKQFRSTSLIFILIVIIAAMLRLWQIGSVPLSPDWDEASLGYNAYSILKTGKDEYGNRFPVVLRSFGDYKPALYTYLIVPLIPIFDLSLIAIRLPSVIAGLVAVITLYFLVDILFRDKKIALISSFILAISPWHIQFSRVGFEANVGLTCIMLMVLFFLKGLQNGKWLIASAAVAALSLYTYQSEKVFVPLLLISLAIIYRKDLFNLSKKFVISAIIIGAILSLPLGHYMVNHPESVARAKMTSVISKGDSILERSAKRVHVDKKRGDVIGQILNNRRIIFAKTIINGYIVHFDPNWLFITGDMSRHHAPGMGLLYIWELPFLIVGFVCLFSFKNKKSVAVIVSWLLLAPIPAALTFDVPHAVRTMQMLPMLNILSAIGIVSLYSFLQHIQLKRIAKLGIICLCCIVVLGNFLYYLDQYFVQQNFFFAKDWQYGYKEAVMAAEKQKGKFEKIIISSEVPLDQSYIFFLYYLKYPPEKYQKEAIYYNGELDHGFDVYQFRPIKWNNDKFKGGSLFIGSPDDFPKENVVKEIAYPDASPAILFAAPK